MTQWLCCHLGAREHYAVPRALHRAGLLRVLLTDAWVPPGSALATLSRPLPRLRERYHADLAHADVRASSIALLSHEALWRAAGRRDWDAIVARNAWVQSKWLGVLRGVTSAEPLTLFAHSYSALAVFREAKVRGWRTVLGQIDPGEEHVRIEADVNARHPEFRSVIPPPPQSYFADWRRECELADTIIVNSEWSQTALERCGVAADKLRVIRLPYEPEFAIEGWRRDYPERFTSERPLRVLFVGSATPMKGVPELLKAITGLSDVPVVLSLVGAQSMRVPSEFTSHPRITWCGAVTRQAVMRHYRSSDVLVFPSRSDGFGMAQVEAQGWSLPIVASKQCGRVVVDGVNGLLLDEVSEAAIANALRRLAVEPRLLAGMAASARAETATIDQLSASLASLS